MQIFIARVHVQGKIAEVGSVLYQTWFSQALVPLKDIEVQQVLILVIIIISKLHKKVDWLLSIFLHWIVRKTNATVFVYAIAAV